MGDFRRNILRTDFEENNSCKEIPGGKKFPTPKTKYLSWLIILGKKSYTLYIREKFFYQEFGGRTVLTQTKSPLRPPPFPLPRFKGQMVGPQEIFYWS